MAGIVLLAVAFTIVNAYLWVAVVIVCHGDTFNAMSDAGSMCAAVGASGDSLDLKWLLIVLTPALVLLGSQAAPWFRRHLLKTVVFIVAGAGGAWLYVISFVNGDFGGRWW